MAHVNVMFLYYLQYITCKNHSNVQYVQVFDVRAFNKFTKISKDGEEITVLTIVYCVTETTSQVSTLGPESLGFQSASWESLCWMLSWSQQTASWCSCSYSPDVWRLSERQWIWHPLCICWFWKHTGEGPGWQGYCPQCAGELVSQNWISGCFWDSISTVPILPVCTANCKANWANKLTAATVSGS